MQILGFMLVFAFMVVWPALAGNSDAGRRGIGTFAYSGSPVSMPQAIVVAAR